MPFKSKIRTIPHYPKEGIMYRDITTLLRDPEGFQKMVQVLIDKYQDVNFDMVVGIESRGFILGSALAFGLKKGFVPIRKKGKLPGATFREDYELEYGVDSIEIHVDALSPKQKVLLVDDLLATGGTILGSINLLKKCDVEIISACFLVNLPDLGGEGKLRELNVPVHYLVEFEGD